MYEQEKRREEEEAEAQLNMLRAQEAAHAKMARDLSNEVKLLSFLENLKRIFIYEKSLFKLHC